MKNIKTNNDNKKINNKKNNSEIDIKNKSKKKNNSKINIKDNEIIKYIITNKRNFILIGSILLFIYITYAIFNNKITELDELVHSYILNIRTNSLTNILLIITNISSAYALIVISIILLASMKNKQIPLLISLNLICAYITNAIAKLIFLRPRPEGINLIEESGFSYPSGHAMISMSFFGFIAYLLYKKQNNKITKSVLIILLILTIITIGFSRIYLGVHYLSDVIGGFLLSIIYLIIYIKLIKLENK